jgi:hypothetical protein
MSGRLSKPVVNMVAVIAFLVLECLDPRQDGCVRVNSFVEWGGLHDFYSAVQ